MLKKISIGVIVLISITTWSQKKSDTNSEKNHFWQNVRYGGGIQLSISNGYTAIGISPSAIYEVSDKFASGMSVSYLYSKFKLQDLRYNVYGASVLALYNPIKEIQISTEFEELSINSNHDESYWIPAWYMGLAYSMGRHTAIGVRYDVLFDDNKSIYDSSFTPFVRIYF